MLFVSVSKMYGGVGFASSGGFNPALPPNNSL
jgi:hypothetical protein